MKIYDQTFTAYFMQHKIAPWKIQRESDSECRSMLSFMGLSLCNNIFTLISLRGDNVQRHSIGRELRCWREQNSQLIYSPKRSTDETQYVDFIIFNNFPMALRRSFTTSVRHQVHATARMNRLTEKILHHRLLVFLITTRKCIHNVR